MPSSDPPDRVTMLRRAIDLKRSARRPPDSLPPRPGDIEPHLGRMQRGLWLLHEIHPTSVAYNLVRGFRVRGPVDAARLERSFADLVCRHRLLRSTYQPTRRGTVQVVHDGPLRALERVTAPVGEGLAVATDEARRPFDLRTGPLVRLVLVQTPDPTETLLLLVMHHILADERSLDQLWRELAAAYRGEAPAAPPPRQYDDYVYWESGRGRERERSLAYWRRRLVPAPDPLMLPFERTVAGPASTRGQLVRAPLPRPVSGDLRRIAAASGTTPFMVFAFVFRLLLARYGASETSVLATPTSTRSHPALADMIGYFLNPVVIAARIDDTRSVDEALRLFAGDARDDLAHASLPFDDLAAELAPTRRADRHPIFQTMFVYQSVSPPPVWGDVPLEPVSIDLGEAKLDLTAFVSESPDAAELAIEFREDRFDRPRMELMLGHYATLLENLPAGMDRPVAALPLLTPPETDRLRAWRGSARQKAGAAPLPEQVRARMRRAPESTAVVSAGRRWSYAELEVHTGAVGARLRGLGVARGARVGVLLERSPEMVAAVLASHWAGAAYVPLDPTYPSSHTAAVIEDAGVAAVVTTATGQELLPDSVPAIRLDVDPTGGSVDDEKETVEPEDPAYVLYTSGSTGRPKGVVVTHDNLAGSTAARMESYEPPGRFLLLPSLAFDSSVAGIFWTLAAGGTLVIPTDDDVADPRRLAALAADERVTTLLCIPSLYAAMLRLGSASVPSLSIVIVAGERCPRDLVRQHFRVRPQTRLFNEYGPTEGTVWATVHEASADDAGPVPIGQPIAGIEAHVLDGHGFPVPAGVPGEIWLTGATVAAGYWRRPELTAERFVSPGNGRRDGARWYRTGDYASWRDDGQLLFLGRRDDQVKLRGVRIELEEIELALTREPDVTEAAVVAVPGSADASDGSSEPAGLAAFLQTAVPRDADRRRDALRDVLPRFMIPERYVELAQLPRLPNGKVDRAALHQLAAERPVQADAAKPETELEQGLVAVWEGLLGRRGLGIDDNFFELGGHSLLVVDMIDTIAKDYGVTLVAADVFAHPTIRELAARVAGRGGSAASPYAHLFPLQPGGHATPLIVAIPHFFSEMFVSRFRGERPVYGLRGVGIRPEGNAGRWRTMTSLAEELVREISRRFPEGPYVIAGYSFGASMAFETVRLMEQRGLVVSRLLMIAPMALDYRQLGPFRVQIDGLRAPVHELSLAEALRGVARQRHPLTASFYRRLWHQTAIRPWRRLLSLVGRLYRLAGVPLTPGLLHADVRAERFRLHRRFRPGVVTTPTVIFNPREPETDAAATWRRSFAGPVTVCETPDPHDGDQSVRRAAEVILPVLDELDGAMAGDGRS